uniref:E4 protein n=1 Tax=Human papillomavirus TaxID=10566 RepID=A0A385PKU9_9PAPI|nr:MAG: E4 protein [Human papillomavirus]
MKTMSGIKLKGKLITMDCILPNWMGLEIISYYLKKMPIDMERLVHGLLIITINKFCPLLLALPGNLFLTPKRTPPTGNLPPPSPHPKKKTTEEERFARRRGALALPPDTHADDDEEEENKENLPPPPRDDEELKVTEHLITSLLKKLEEVIDLYNEQVSEELSALKRKLGIRQ